MLFSPLPWWLHRFKGKKGERGGEERIRGIKFGPREGKDALGHKTSTGRSDLYIILGNSRSFFFTGRPDQSKIAHGKSQSHISILHFACNLGTPAHVGELFDIPKKQGAGGTAAMGRRAA